MSPAVDRISTLPKHVIEVILMHLPLRDAVRTSILSRYWRYEWNTLPQLVFDCECVAYRRGKGYKTYDEKLVDIVNQVMFLHRGPIHKFHILFHSDYSEGPTHVDRWLTFLGRNGIKELNLYVMQGEVGSYEVSWCLYLCKELTCLELDACDITLPASFKGFSSLTTLELNSVNICDSELELLISLCPLLKKLILKLMECYRLNICAPKLVELEFDIDFKDVCFENTPLLASLSIYLYCDFEGPRVDTYATVDKLAQFFASLPRIERLDLSGDAFECFSKGKVPSKFPTACHLKYLSIILHFEDKQEILLAVCIFRSSPMLQDLSIEASPLSELFDHVDIRSFWEAPPDFTYLFSQLRTLKVIESMGTIYELKLVESILANAPMLEKVVIYFKKRRVALKTLKKMINFQRASSKAQFCFPYGSGSRDP